MYRRMIFCALILESITATAATGYSFKELKAPNSISTIAMDINESGVIVGGAILQGGANMNRAAFWNGDFNQISGSGSIALKISNSNHISVEYLDANQNPQAAVYHNGTLNALTLQRHEFAYIGGVNSSGTAVANVVAPDLGYQYGLSWNGDARTFYRAGKYSYNQPTDINDSGVIVGSTGQDGDINTVAARWENGDPVRLPLLSGLASGASAVNNAGVSVGWATLEGEESSRGVVWQNDTVTDTGTLGGDFSSLAAINIHGFAVGESTLVAGRPAPSHATLWNGADLIDLNTQVDSWVGEAGWVLLNARGINDVGQIVGAAFNTKTQRYAGFVLSPVPEPASMALMSAGGALLLALARRRQFCRPYR